MNLNGSKPRGWKIGIISEDLYSAGGTIIKKGANVYYKRVKTLVDKDGFKLTEYEWHYTEIDKPSLIRTTELIIEGEEFFQEPYYKKN